MNTAVRERPSVDARGRAAVVAPVDPAVPAWLLPLIVVLGIALRVWRVVSNGLSFDEAFTARAGRLPVGDLLTYLRHNDSHPPLDYLVRAPLARAGASDFLLRSPSLLFSSAALVLFAWWMRGRSWLGVIATALMAVSTFQVLYGGDARMYALLQLLGVTAAIVTERWLRASAPWHAWAIGAVLLVALFDHVSGALLGAGLLAVAGFRRDREAWRWRLVVTGAGLVWLAVWGPVMLDQLEGQWASWIPRTTALGFAQTLSRQVTLTEAIAPFVLAAVIAGGVVLWRRDHVLGRLWLALGVLPFVLAAVIGVFASFLFDRTLTLASWAPLLALAFLLDGARRRWRTAGTAIALTVVLIVTTASCTFFLDKRWEYDLSVERLEQVARPGDVIAVRPARYGILVDWRVGVRGDRATRHVRVPDLGDADTLLLTGAAKTATARTGRIWLLTPLGDASPYDAFRRCADDWRDEAKKIVCLQRR